MKYYLLFALVFTSLFASAQAFTGLYSIGNATFRAKVLSEKDAQQGLYNLVYTKGSKLGTMVSISEHPKFEFVFDEHEGDIYFTKAWKGKPLEGYYIRAKDKKRFKVKFIRE